MKLSIKLMIMFSSVILIVVVSLGGYSAVMMKNEVTHLAEKKLATNEAMAKALLNEKYPGEWEIKNTKLYKGETLMENNRQAVESINKLTGDSIVIFKGKISVATADDSMANNESMSSLETEVQKTVLEKGEAYLGSSHNGEELSLYEPIRNKQGNVIGAFHVSMPKEMYEHASQNFRKSMIWFALIGLLVSLIVAAYLSVRFVRPILQMTHLMEKVSVGDLRVDLLVSKSRDELGRLAISVNQMVRGLQEMVHSVKEVSIGVHHSSLSVDEKTKQIAEMALDVNSNVIQVESGALKQAQGMNASANAMDDISENIQHIAETTSIVALTSSEMLEHADRGNQSIQTAVEEIHQLNETTRLMADSINELYQMSDNVSSIAGMITEISSQTHLLALNAAIEAARAGENGRGFTVVADEVKKLAEQSERSSHEIQSLIDTVQTKTSDAAEMVELGLKQLDRGIKVLQKAGQAFSNIVNSAGVVAKQNQEISTATQEISAGIEEIASSFQTVSSIADETVKNVQHIMEASHSQVNRTEDISETSSKMLETIEKMRKAVNQFQV